MKQSDCISFIGLGKLGLPLASCIAESGKSVLCIDKNEYVLEVLRDGKLPFFEPGLEDLFESSQKQFMGFSDSYKDIVEKTDTTVILVNTQLGDNGYSSEFVESALTDLSVHLKRSKKPYHTILLSSTVLPGEICCKLIPLVERISGRILGESFGFAYVPDFVKLGKVIQDFKNPEFFLVGANNEVDYKKALDCFSGIHVNSPSLHHLTLEETEVAKVALNAYIVEKISFANFLGHLCEDLPNVNVHSITEVIGKDCRISPHFFKSGTPYGGTCFPRDTQAFIKFAEDRGARAKNIEFAEEVNTIIQKRLVQLTVDNLEKKVGILGTSFKPDSPVTVGSPAFPIINAIVSRGGVVSVYDKLCSSYRDIYIPTDAEFMVCSSAQECVNESDIVLVLHYDKDFMSLDFSNKIVIDPWGIIK